MFTPKLRGKTVVIFVDFTFEDMEVMYPKIRLEEEGAKVLVVGAAAGGTKYTGKYGYPIKSDASIDDINSSEVHSLILPGGFAPDYMRRNKAMLKFVCDMVVSNKPVASICHGPWMLCSARLTDDGPPIIAGRRATSFIAIKDDLVNAGATYVDEPVVVDGPIITSRTPGDLVPFVHAIISAMI
jgi:protease I